MSIHEGFLALAAAAIDFELDEYERAELERHKAGCDACRRTAAAFRDDAAAIAAEPGPSLSPERSAAILAAALRPGRNSPPLRLLAVAALIGILGAGAAVGGALYLGRSDDPPLAVVPSPSPSATPGLASPSVTPPTASPAATLQPTSAPPPDGEPPAAVRPLVRGSAKAFGHQIGIVPAADGNLYVSIPGPDGAVLALLDGSGRPRTGWPIEIPKATSCGDPMVADDGSVRIICDGTDLPRFDNDPSDVRAFAFDASGRSMPGWPVQLRPAMGRVIGNDLILLTLTYGSDTFEVGTVSHVASVTIVTADGSTSAGEQVPMVETCCPEKWAIGPDGIAYGIVFHRPTEEALTTSELVAVGPLGVRAGFPVALEGVASKPAFDAHSRIHVTVATVSVESPYHGPARTHVFDTDGRAVAGGSTDLGFVATDTCDGIEGSCEGPAAPLVGQDGTTFVIGMRFQDTTAARVTPSGDVMAGWPYRSDDGSQPVGFCPPTDICEGSELATHAIGPDNVLYLIHGAETETTGGHLVAVGEAGRVVTGWPVGLRRVGSAFWSVVVGPDGMVYALAVEPEKGDTYSATILGIAPDSTIRYTTTIVDP